MLVGSIALGQAGRREHGVHSGRLAGGIVAIVPLFEEPRLVMGLGSGYRGVQLLQPHSKDIID